MLNSVGIVLFVAVFSLARVQVCLTSPPLRTCANVPFSSCRFGDASSRCPSVCSYFFDAVETALVGDASALYSLQRAFFPEGQQQPNVVDIYVTLVLEQAIDLPCNSEINDYRDRTVAELRELDVSNVCSGSNCTRLEYRWHHVWTSAVLTNVIERESLGLISSINTMAYITRLYSESQTNIIITNKESDFQPRETAFLELNIPILLCLPNNTEATLQGAWEDILPWIHAYTQRRGSRVFFSDFDRAFIFEDSNIDPDSERIFGIFQRREVDENVFIPFLTTLHILLQVAIGLTIMKLVPSYYSSVSQGKEGKKVKKKSPSVSIFWANVLFAFAIDIFFVGIDLYLIISVYGGVESAIGEIITSSNRSTLETVFVFGMLGTLVTFILVSLQFFVAAGIPKNTELHIPGILRLLCCFFPCRCRRLDGDFWRKALQTFAIWSLMVFLQLVAGSVIPYLVLAIVNPVPSVTFLALGASTLFCLIMFVASLIHISVEIKKSSCYDKIVAVVQGLVFIVFLGLVAITVIIYQGVIQSGTSTGFVSGIALSLIPSGIIAILGVAVKFKLLSETDDDDPEHQDDTILTRATSLIRRKLSTRRIKDRHQKEKAPDDSNETPGSDHPETENDENKKKIDISKEDPGNEDSNDKKSDHNHTPSYKKKKIVSEVKLIEYGEDEIGSGNGSSGGAKESDLEDPSTEAKSKTEPPETKLEKETTSGNDSSGDKKEPDFKDPYDAEDKPEPAEFELHVNGTAVEAVRIDFTDFDTLKR